MRKALGPVLALSVMLASSAPFSARARSPGASAVVAARDGEAEGLLRAVHRPLFLSAGVAPAPVRVALIQGRPINAFDTSGNLLFIAAGLVRRPVEADDRGVLTPGPLPADPRRPAGRDTRTREQREHENAMRRRSSP